MRFHILRFCDDHCDISGIHVIVSKQLDAESPGEQTEHRNKHTVGVQGSA